MFCATCGHRYDDHPFRHPFKGQVPPGEFVRGRRSRVNADNDKDAEIARLRAEVERLNGILDAERDMQAKLVAEGTRLSADLAAARAAIDKERGHADLLAFVLDKAAETRREVADEHRARRAAEAKGAT